MVCKRRDLSATCQTKKPGGVLDNRLGYVMGGCQGDFTDHVKI